MGIADLHAHTRHTSWGDGNQTVEDIFRYVSENTDIDIFAITDHDSVDAARYAQDLYHRNAYRFHFIPGVEITNLGGHLLCYFPHNKIVDIPSLRPFWWTVRYAQAHGAICVPAHPVFPPWLASTLRKGLNDGLRLAAIEVINAGLQENAQRRLTAMAGDFPDLAHIGNSDAHDEVAIGAAYTRFPGSTVDDFLQALSKRTTEPVFVRRPQLDPAARAFTTRRSMTRPGWVRNIWRELVS